MSQRTTSNGTPLKPSGNGTPPAPSIDANHGPGGRFCKGNKAARGNPFIQRLTRNRSLFLETIDEEKLKAIVTKLYWEARGGSMEAIKIVLQYCVGRPLPLPDAVPEDRDDADE
jgi:hypothetical protein